MFDIRNINKRKFPFSRAGVFLAAVVIIAIGVYWKFFSQGLISREKAQNVLLVTIDTLRADHVGAFGAAENIAKTPAMDALAEDGIAFTNAYSAAYPTTPSHVSILTGLYAVQHGIYDSASIIPESAKMIQEILSSEGYDTAAFISAILVTEKLGFARGFDHFDEWYDPKMERAERRAEQATDSALGWLRNHKKASFFVWVHYYDPHGRYIPPTGFRNDFLPVESILDRCDKEIREIAKSGNIGPLTRGTRAFYFPSKNVENGWACVLPETDYINIEKALYSGEVLYADHHLGRLVEWLKKNGKYEDTTVVVVSDHGETLDEPRNDEFDHKTLFHEVTRVPLIIKPPAGKYYADESSEIPASTVDVVPTILEFLGIDISRFPQISGISLAGVFRGQKGRYAMDRPQFFEGTRKYSTGVKISEKKFMHHRRKKSCFPDFDCTEQLFDMDADPGERDDLATGVPEEVQRMKSIIEEWEKSMRNKTPDVNPNKYEDSDFKEKIKQLGYI